MKTKELENAKNELIAWLNDECPSCFPPLEPYTTADLSHDFADKLRERLDNIIILRGKMAESADISEGEKEKQRFKVERVVSDREKIMAKYNINEDMVDDYMKQFPRRNNLSLCTPAELAIFKAMQEVEKVGADVKLTDAIVLLGKAKDCVSDFIDGVTDIDSDKENDIHYWKCPECNSIFATSKHTPEWMAQKTAIIHTNTLYDIPCRAEYVEITKEEFFRIDAKRDDTIKKKVCE